MFPAALPDPAPAFTGAAGAGGGVFPCAIQSLVDHAVKIRNRVCAFKLLAVDEQHRRSAQPQCVPFFDRCLHRAVVLLRQASVQLRGVHLLLRPLIPHNRIERVVRDREALLRSAQFARMLMDVVDHVPVPGHTLRAHAVRVDRRSLRPRMHRQRIVLVHKVNLVLVPRQQRRKHLRMQPRAERALQIVEAHNRNRRRNRSAPCRPARVADRRLRILADVVLAELRQRPPVVGDQEVHRLALLAIRRERNRDLPETRNIALRLRPDRDRVVRRHIGPRPDQHFDPPRQLRRKRTARHTGSGRDSRTLTTTSRSGGQREHKGKRKKASGGIKH